MTQMMKVTCTVPCVVLVVVSMAAYSAANCVFLDNIKNLNWTTNNFGVMQFKNSTVTFTQTFGVAATVQNWECAINTETKLILKSDITVFSFNENSNFYYCMNLTKLTEYSYSYYLLANYDQGFNARVVALPNTISDASVEASACSNALSIDKAEYNVMIVTDHTESAKQYCADPLLGSFRYAITNGTAHCGNTSHPTGDLEVCDTRTTLSFNYSHCDTKVANSANGTLNCVAYASATNGTTTTYYQTVYNNDSTLTATNAFSCLALTKNVSVNGTTTITTLYMSVRAMACQAGQSSMEVPTTVVNGGFPGATLELTAYELCPFEIAAVTTDSNTALIVGLAVGLSALVIAACVVIIYCCCCKCNNPNALKPIVENTKPKFEDPDKTELPISDLEFQNTSSPVTRDEILFQAFSPNFYSNGKVSNGKISNVNLLSLSPNGTLNGSVRRDSGIAMTVTNRSIDRPTPRIGINPTKETMVIFNGDEKVVSGNNTRIVPNENREARTLTTYNSLSGQLEPLSINELDHEEGNDGIGDLSPSSRDMSYPSFPREKSNLLPPMETADPEKENK